MGRVARVQGGPRDGEVKPVEARQSIWDAKWGDEWYCYHLDGGAWRFMGDDAHRCLNCYAVVQVPRDAACPLCGADGEG